jgi:hypothetical protein
MFAKGGFDLQLARTELPDTLYADPSRSSTRRRTGAARETSRAYRRRIT